MQQPDTAARSVTILGDDSLGGAYVIRISLNREAKVRFGRFRGGQPIRLPVGDYLYVGSARSTGHSRALARRLLRHATRTGSRRPHKIRKTLHACLEDAGLIEAGRTAPREKRLRWHVDYLLDLHVTEITGVLAVCSDRDLEKRMARWLSGDCGADVLCKGLGASDDPGATHLFRVSDGDRVWERLVLDLGNL